MATQTIEWNDGTCQKLYLQYASNAAGTSTVTVTADKSANSSARSKTIKLTPNGGTSVNVIIRQSAAPRVRNVNSSTYNLMITKNATVTFVPNHDMNGSCVLLEYDGTSETYKGIFSSVNAGESYTKSLAAGTYHLGYTFPTGGIIRAIIEY